METATGHPPGGGGRGAASWTMEELSAVNEVAAAVSGQLDLHEVLEVGLDTSLRALGLDKGWIRLFDESGRLKVRAVRGLSTEHVTSLMALQATEGVCGAAIEHGEPIVIHGAPGEPADVFPVLRSEGLHSYLGIPLMIHGRPRGVLVVASSKPHEFTSRQRDLMSIIAAQVLIAIEHALLHQQIEAERRGREEALRGVRRFLQATIDALPARICVLDERGVIIFVNDAWDDFVRQGIAEPGRSGLGVDYLAVSDEAARAGDPAAQEAAAGIRAVLAGAADSFSLDYPCQSPDEKYFFNMRATALEDKGARRVVIAHHDVTPIKLAEEEMRRALEEMQKLALFKDEFLSGVTHDLKTPLVPVKGFLDLLLSERAGPLSEKQKTFLAYCESALVRQTNMIDDLQAATRIQARQVRFEPEPLDVRKPLAASLQFLGLLARDRRLAVEARVPDQELRVRGEARKLERIFNNLFSNAVRHNVEDGRVSVRAWAEGDRVMVSVADTGVGIAAAEREKIFERYYQAPGRRGGTGLGLSVVREFVRLHGGQISVESEPGRGSVFTVSLPRLA